MGIRLQLIGLMVVSCALMLYASAQAASYAAFGFGVQPSTEPDRPAVSETARQHYQSLGQDYLRTYLRENVQRFMADNGVAVDPDEIKTVASVNLTRLYSFNSPLKTRMRVLADDDVARYLSCGRSLPIKVEMDSTYPLLPDLDLEARLKAPFNDLFQAEFGSLVRWSSNVDSKVVYMFRQSNRLYSGVSVSTNVHWDDWSLELGYNLTPDAVRMQSISVGKNF